MTSIITKFFVFIFFAIFYTPPLVVARTASGTFIVCSAFCLLLKLYFYYLHCVVALKGFMLFLALCTGSCVRSG